MLVVKHTYMNVQFSLIQKLMLYEFKQGHNALEAMKNIHQAKGEVTINHSSVGWLSKKFCSGCTNLNDQARSVYDSRRILFGDVSMS